MAKISHFSELQCWQEARELVRLVRITLNKYEELNKEFSLKDQMNRASLSVMNNIAEGFGRYSDKEFIRFLNISNASCYEVESMIYVLEDFRVFTREDLEKLQNQVRVTTAKTLGLIRYLKNKKT